MRTIQGVLRLTTEDRLTFSLAALVVGPLVFLAWAFEDAAVCIGYLMFVLLFCGPILGRMIAESIDDRRLTAEDVAALPSGLLVHATAMLESSRSKPITWGQVREWSRRDAEIRAQNQTKQTVDAQRFAATKRHSETKIAHDRLPPSQRES